MLIVNNEKTPVSWLYIAGVPYYKISFDAILTKAKAVTLAELWRRDFEEPRAVKITVILDASRMLDYEPLARGIWQKTFSSLKPKINEIWVVTDSKRLVIGAAIINIFSSVPIKTARSVERVLNSGA